MNQTEIDGVRTFWFDAPGPVRAGLLFRVGVVDEELPTHGLTHFIEHMILRSAPRGTLGFNGIVEPLRTGFFAAGEADEVTDFINSVARDITRLCQHEFPLDRLDLERQVLLTEAAGRGADALGALLAFRWGPRGIGLTSYDELGLHVATQQSLEDWAGRFFCSGNAVLWITKSPPSDLDIRLPDGAQVAPPAIEPLDVPTPGWFARPTRTIGCGMTASRSFSASALAAVLDQRLRERIRHDLGLSYEVAASYLPYSAERAHLALFADALPENASKVRDALRSAIAEVADGASVQHELDTYRTLVKRAWDDPANAPAILDQEATRWLLRQEERFEDLIEELDRLQPTDVSGALEESLPDALYLLAADDEFPEMPRVPEFSSAVVAGKRYPLSQKRAGQVRGAARQQRLVVGDEGASLLFTKNKKVTVRFDEAEALARWNDGSVCLFGSDGFTLVIRPEDWRFGRKAVEKVEKSFPGEPIVLTGEGPASPLATSLESPRAPLGFMALALFVALGAAANLIDPDPENADGVARAISGLLMVGLIAVAASQFRKYRKLKEEQ